jgi:cytochrome c biogenesis protein CcmG/thiol:disulfide interchange protein DsbE
VSLRNLFLLLLIPALLLSLTLADNAIARTNVQEGETALDFSLPDIRPDAPQISLSSLRGQVVYVDFWASWCLPCLRSLPEINALYEKYRDQGFEVIAITIDNPVQDAEEFLEDLDVPLGYLVAVDADSDVMYDYGVVGMPTSFLIDRDGVVRKVHEGYRDGDIEKLEAALLPLL